LRARHAACNFARTRREHAPGCASRALSQHRNKTDAMNGWTTWRAGVDLPPIGSGYCLILPTIVALFTPLRGARARCPPPAANGRAARASLTRTTPVGRCRTGITGCVMSTIIRSCCRRPVGSRLIGKR
jgi:hypothetical protein